MILIFSREPEVAVNGVLLWLHHYQADYIRITENTQIEIKEVKLDDHSCHLCLNINGRQVHMDAIQGCWIYHGHLGIDNLKIDRHTYQNHPDTLMNALERDIKTLLDFTKYLLEQINCIGKFNEQNTNKLKYLFFARKAGLLIPPSAVLTSQTSLARYQKEQKRLITKSIQDSVIVFFNGYYYLNYTERMMAADIRKLPETFFPSFFQREVKKFADIRVFYLDGECYSMAIFSQQSKMSSTDFRKYPSSPNRYIPFRLSPTYTAQVIAFMEQTGHRTGSLDLVLTADGTLIFLEINPVGQFGFVSYCCNYQLEKKLANCLQKASDTSQNIRHELQQTDQERRPVSIPSKLSKPETIVHTSEN